MSFEKLLWAKGESCPGRSTGVACQGTGVLTSMLPFFVVAEYQTVPQGPEARARIMVLFGMLGVLSRLAESIMFWDEREAPTTAWRSPCSLQPERGTRMLRPEGDISWDPGLTCREVPALSMVPSVGCHKAPLGGKQGPRLY